MLMRFDPFRELDRLSGQAANGWSAVPTRQAPMPMDAYRHGEEFLVHFDLPGVDPQTIELTVEKNVLAVQANRRWQRAEGDEVLVAERPQGSFTRQLFLGDGLDTDNIAANYENGVLTLTIPMAERAKPRRVEVTAQKGGGKAAVEASSAA